MLLTDVKKEFEGILRSENLTQAETGRRAGMDRRDIFSYFKCGFYVSKTLVRIMEAIGYDIELSFVKRHE